MKASSVELWTTLTSLGTCTGWLEIDITIICASSWSLCCGSFSSTHLSTPSRNWSVVTRSTRCFPSECFDASQHSCLEIHRIHEYSSDVHFYIRIVHPLFAFFEIIFSLQSMHHLFCFCIRRYVIIFYFSAGMSGDFCLLLNTSEKSRWCYVGGNEYEWLSGEPWQFAWARARARLRAY